MLGQLSLIFLASLITWLFLAVYFAVAQNYPREIFIPIHYLVSFLSTFLVFYLFSKFTDYFSPFNTMIFAMISLFIIEILVFTFLYKEELWFLNFVDWMVPVMIISTTIYFTVMLFS